MNKWLADIKKHYCGKSTTSRATRRRPARTPASTSSSTRARPPPPASRVALAEALVELQELTERLRRDGPGTASRRRARSCRTPSRRRTRSPTPRSAATRRSCSTSSATCSSRSTSSRCCWRSRARATSRRSRAACTRSSCAGTRTSSARSRPTPRPRARELGADQARAGGARGRLPRRPRGAAGAALRAQGAAARAGGRLRVPEPRGRRSPTSTTSCASCEAELGGRRAGARDRARPARLRGARRRALRGRERRPAAERRPGAGAAGGERPLRRAGRAGRELAAGEGKRWTELELDEQDRYFDLAKEAGT